MQIIPFRVARGNAEEDKGDESRSDASEGSRRSEILSRILSAESAPGP